MCDEITSTKAFSDRHDYPVTLLDIAEHNATSDIRVW